MKALVFSNFVALFEVVKEQAWREAGVMQIMFKDCINVMLVLYLVCMVYSFKTYHANVSKP